MTNFEKWRSNLLITEAAELLRAYYLGVKECSYCPNEHKCAWFDRDYIDDYIDGYDAMCLENWLEWLNTEEKA